MRKLGLILVLFILGPIAYSQNSHPNRYDNSQLLAANVPPGLHKKGMHTIPSYLGKTPPGWDEGLKKGWDKNRDWRWNKSNKMWENKHWRWDSTKKTWKNTKGW